MMSRSTSSPAGELRAARAPVTAAALKEGNALQRDQPAQGDLQLLPRFGFAVEPPLAVIAAALQEVEVAVAS